jgi:allantoicase
VTGAGGPGLPDFARLPDLAARRVGGSVVYANDELFAEKENLIKAGQPAFAAGEFGHKGKIYDGWETRRRRDSGHDHAIIRLGLPGVVRGVVVDTSFFLGNYPPQVSVEAIAADGYPSPPELAGMRWHSLVDRTAAAGGCANAYPVTSDRRWTHVRLSIYPDGGVARLRVHGQPVPDPAFLDGTIDLAALENGGQLTGCSDAFYSSAVNLIMPGRAASMADGWENARRRDGGLDYATFALAGKGLVRQVEIDTSYFVGNAPGWARLLAAVGPLTAPDARAGARARSGPDDASFAPVASASAAPVASAGPDAADPGWYELLARTPLQPDTRHRFLVAAPEPATHVRLEVYPDGGLARLRILGELVPDGLARLRARYASVVRGDVRQARPDHGPAPD